MTKLSDRIKRRKARVRGRLRGAPRGERKRLSVFRSVQAHLRPGDRRRPRRDARRPPPRSRRRRARALKTGANVEAAKAVGKLIAERAKAKGVKDVVFDRGGYLYHGRVKALADAAREGGLNF